MSIVDIRSIDSLSERLRQANSDSESTDHDRNDAQPAMYAPAFGCACPDLIPRSMTSSIRSGRVPSLTGETSVASSSTTHTENARALHGGCFLSNNNGILTLPSADSDADLLCPFQILDCCDTFSDIRDFKIHVFSHFRGHTLPVSATCFLCPRKFAQTITDDGAYAWNNMLSHLAGDHFRGGQGFGTMRPDFTLMRWMYDRKIVSDHVFKRAQTCPATTVFPAGSRRPSEVSSLMPEAPSPPSGSSDVSTVEESMIWPRRSTYSTQTYVQFAGPRAERRRRDSTRPVFRPLRPVVN